MSRMKSLETFFGHGKSAAFIILVSLSVTAQAEALNEIREFNIKPQPLDAALIEFSEQANLQLMVPTELVDGLHSPGINGEFVATVALAALLNDNDLIMNAIGEDTVALSKSDGESQPGKSQPALSQVLMAQVQTSAQENQTGNFSETTNDAFLPLEEIVVTARYREENLQQVPLSETVFTSKQITDARIDQVADFVALTPNITMRESTDNGGSAITIRGLTQVRNIESPVAIRVDGVQQVNAAQFTQELFDIETIEVLRGPQGAIYGRNATGGAIIIKTRQPTNELTGSVKMRIGENDEYLLQGSISGAIVEDKLYGRVGFSTQKRDGYVINTTLDDYVDPYEDQSVRGKLQWRASDSLTVDFHLAISDTKSGANNWFYNIPADADFVDFTNQARVIGRMEREISDFALKFEYESSFGTFTSISTKNLLESRQAQKGWPYGPTVNGSVIVGFTEDGPGQQAYLDIDSFSQEFRLASTADGNFRWMLGAFWLNSDRYLALAGGADQDGVIPFVERAPVPGVTEDYTGANIENNAWALFGNVDIDLTDKFTLSLAYRYDEDELEQTVSPLQTDAFAGQVSNVTFNQGQPKIALLFAATDTVNIYGSWGVGFRSGGFNQAGIAELANDVVGLSGVQDIVRPEKSDTFELGIKSDIFDGRARLNAAIFSTRLDDSFYYTFDADTGGDVLFNIDEIDLQGFEVEFTWKANEYLDIYAAYGYTDSEIKRFDIEQRGGGAATIGNKAPHVPESSVNLGFQYRRPVSDTIGIFLRTDYEVMGKQYWDPFNTTARSNVNLLNLRAGLEGNDGRWSVIVTLENALDEIYNREYFSLFPADEGSGFAWLAEPRVWSVDATYSF